MRPFRNRLDLLPHELLELIRALRVRRRLIVVLPAIVVDQHCILDEVLRRRVKVFFMLLLHRRQVHRLRDDVVVVRHLVAVDRLGKWPGRAVVLKVVEEVE